MIVQQKIKSRCNIALFTSLAYEYEIAGEINAKYMNKSELKKIANKKQLINRKGQQRQVIKKHKKQFHDIVLKEYSLDSY